MFTYNHMLCVMYDVSHVMCQISHFAFHMPPPPKKKVLKKMVELVGGGSVNNGTTLSSLLSHILKIQRRIFLYHSSPFFINFYTHFHRSTKTIWYLQIKLTHNLSTGTWKGVKIIQTLPQNEPLYKPNLEFQKKMWVQVY